MAAKGILGILRSVFGIALPALLAMPSVAAATQEERRCIVLDFSRGKKHVLFVCIAKFGHWRGLPWLLFGLGHHDVGEAKSCARRALDLYDGSPPEVKTHAIVRALCAPGSCGRVDLERFCGGDDDVHAYPLLATWAAKFAFTPITERWVEGLHASAKRALVRAPHHSAQHLAWTITHPSVRELLQSGSVGIDEFGRVCHTVRNPRGCLEQVGLWHRTDVQEVCQQHRGNAREFSRSQRQWVVEVLFHVDLETLFRDARVVPLG